LTQIWRQIVTKFPLVATLLLAAATPAVAQEKTSFTQDGVTYTYTQTKVGDATVIRGHSTSGPDFYYVVRDGKVIGKNDDTPVSFTVQDAKAQADAEAASAR
jgi:hypothetical protein